MKQKNNNIKNSKDELNIKDKTQIDKQKITKEPTKTGKGKTDIDKDKEIKKASKKQADSKKQKKETTKKSPKKIINKENKEDIREEKQEAINREQSEEINTANINQEQQEDINKANKKTIKKQRKKSINREQIEETSKEDSNKEPQEDINTAKQEDINKDQKEKESLLYFVKNYPLNQYYIMLIQQITRLSLQRKIIMKGFSLPSLKTKSKHNNKFNSIAQHLNLLFMFKAQYPQQYQEILKQFLQMQLWQESMLHQDKKNLQIAKYNIDMSTRQFVIQFSYNPNIQEKSKKPSKDQKNNNSTKKTNNNDI